MSRERGRDIAKHRKWLRSHIHDDHAQMEVDHHSVGFLLAFHDGLHGRVGVLRDGWPEHAGWVMVKPEDYR